MRVALACFLLLVVASSASAGGAPSITTSAIGGAQLGWRGSQYVALFGKARVDRLEGGFVRLAYERRKIEVYLRGGKGRAIVTWNRRNRTPEGVGPCSTVRALVNAFGTRVKKTELSKRITIYRLGSLVFTVENGRTVGDVMLAASPTLDFVALNAPECSY